MSSILILTRELPYPPNAGDRIVTHGYVRGLAERGHEVHVLTYRSGESLADVAELREHCESVVRIPGTSSPLPPAARTLAKAARGRSDVMAMFDSSTFREATARRVAAVEPDAVLAQHPYIGQVFRERSVRDAARDVGAQLVTNAHVLEYAAHERRREFADDLRTRAELALEVPRLRRAELAAYRASDLTIVLGAEDERRLRSRGVGPVSRQRVGLPVDSYEPAPLPPGPAPAGNGGVVEDRHDPGADARRSSSHRGKSARGSDPDRLLFFGSYDWFPNEDAALVLGRRIFPRIRNARPEAELELAGRGANDRIESLGDRPGITFRGEVANLESVVRSADVVVAPLRVGGGVRIKVLESMAWRLPVVTTEAGFEGVAASPGEDLLVAGDADQFVDATVSLLRNADERRRVAANARGTIAERYSIDRVAPEVETALGV
ncbi:glycosyltransferase family 4 protein [Halovivax limisalsi]|uniref:glycosyltransferase family 4 protein n=1 Tax=Halovivax limisalsi TaxID=1453760 RepID=UPI001FFD5881|nr:glycosyltransferase family 4 protein [Halovivax limisalsi]